MTKEEKKTLCAAIAKSKLTGHPVRVRFDGVGVTIQNNFVAKIHSYSYRIYYELEGFLTSHGFSIKYAGPYHAGF